MTYMWLILYAEILILSLEFLPCSCLPVSCQGIPNLSQVVYPEGRIYVPYRTELGPEHLIYCVDETYKAQNLEFRAFKGAQPVPSYEVNSTTIVHPINRTVKGDFSYYCLNKVTKKVCTTRVTVDSAPAPVTDFTCKSYNLEVLNCSWTNPDSYSVPNYSLTITFDDNYLTEACVPVTSSKTRYCTWNTTSHPRYRQLEKQFHFNLKYSNVFGSNEQNYTINHYSITKPNPPINLKVVGNGTHSVYLQWSIPNNMVDFLPKSGLEHKIEYRIAKIDSAYYFRAVNTSELPPKNKTYKFLLKDLPYAHMQYEVRIYIRPKEAVKDEYWSDFSQAVFSTESETSSNLDTTIIRTTVKDDSCDISKDGIPIEFPIRLDHDTAGKTSVKLSWIMACTIQEGISTGYLITYCLVKDASNACDPSLGKSIVNVTDPKQMEITIKNLKPFRTYQFYLSISTIYGEKAIENASTRVTTTEDTPSSPRNVTITEVESSSIVISWEPPLENNGIIEKYVIYNYTDEYAIDKVPYKDSMNRRSLKLEGLIAYNKYSLSVVACNTAIDSCSQKSPAKGITVKTRIGSPSKLNSPTFSPIFDSINWLMPEHPGGNIDLYQILKVNNENTEILNTTDSFYFLNNCHEDSRYQVRAVNIACQKGVRLEYPGEWSDPITVTCDVKESPIVLYSVVALAAATVVIVVGYELINFYKRKHY